MKKNLLVPLLCLIYCLTGQAQDQLFLKDNSKLQVKIIEIGTEDVKYKLYSNLNGPTYVENKGNVIMVLFENGRYESFAAQTSVTPDAGPPAMSKKDSLIYFGHPNNISINFFNFFNNELGITYQRDFLKSHFNIVIPVAFGVDKPNITQDVYFGINNTYNSTSSYYTLDKKLFDVGFGINYYPSVTRNINYFIGPVFKYMQFSGNQTYSYYTNYPNYNGGYNTTYNKSSTLSRYSMSITNGFILRTKSRLTLSLYASLGFKNDVLSSELVDPTTNQNINPLRSAVSLFFWSGFNVGFNF